MAGLYSILNIATRGLNVQQQAINVTSHNIANASTPGYTRESATVVSSTSYNATSLNDTTDINQLGNGAEVTDIKRITDSFIDYQTRNANSTNSQYSMEQSALSSVETVINEPSDTGISNQLTQFYNSWQELSKSPDSSSAKATVAQQAQTLATQLNSASKGLTDLNKNAQDDISSTVTSVNSELDQVQQLNDEIIQFKNAGTDPNDLLDKRDALLSDLSSSFNLNVTNTSNGGINVSTVATTDNPAVNLISSDPKTAGQRLAYVNDDNGTFTDYDKNDATQTNLQLILVSPGETASDASGDSNVTTYNPSDGSLKGDIDVQTDINGFIGKLDNLAKSLAYSVNAIESGNTDASNDTTTPFFVNSSSDLSSSANNDDGITAANISVNANILSDPTQIQSSTDSTSGSATSSDGDKALVISNLSNSLINISSLTATSTRSDLFSGTDGNTLGTDPVSFTDSTGGSTIDNYYDGLISDIGVKSQAAQRLSTNQSAVLSSLQDSQTSVSGVSLDEEMANLVQFQNAYQANAKVISIVDSLLNVVINGLMSTT